MAPCQRCGKVADLGKCPGPCHRDLCLSCYDIDQALKGCSLNPPRKSVHPRITELAHSGMSVTEIAEAIRRSKRTVWKVLEKAKAER